MSNVDDAAVATYPAPAVEDERSFLIRVMGWMCVGVIVTAGIASATGRATGPSAGSPITRSSSSG